VNLKFATHLVKWHPWINEEDAAKFKEATTGEIADRIRNWIATDTMPKFPPAQKQKNLHYGWQGRVTLCKGRAIAEMLKAEAVQLTAPRMACWVYTPTLNQWFIGQDSVLTRKFTVMVYGGMDLESFKQKYMRWTRSRRTILVAHHGVLDAPEHLAYLDTGAAPEIVFAEPYWDPERAEAAIRTALRNPQFDTAHIRFVGIKGTLDEEVVRYLTKKTAERF
jgi:hypothetical protein